MHELPPILYQPLVFSWRNRFEQ